MFQSIPTVTKNLLIVNVLAFLATMVLRLRGIDLADLGGLHFFLASDFWLFQLVTYQFLHAGFEHIFFNMFALWMFGVVMERVWGPKKFLFYYIFCGIGAGLCQELVQYVQYVMDPISALPVDSMIPVRSSAGVSQMQVGEYLNGWNTIGASGAVYAILLAFGMSFPNERIMLLIPPIPLKAKWLVVGYAVIELFLAISSPGSQVAHMAHLGGMLFGFFLIRYWNKHPNARFNRNNGMDFFESMKRNYEKRQQQKRQQADMKPERGGRAETDMEYNARKKQNQEVIDRILDKIRKSGYDSLTQEEKKTLFEASRDN
jgi:membrane associated rhomboid family serine protease